MMSWIKLGTEADLLQAAQATRFKIGRKSAFIFRYQDQWYAYENACPHLGVELDWAPGEVFDQEQQHLICSTHGALFEPQTGQCISGPCQGQALTPLKVRVQAGKVYCAEQPKDGSSDEGGKRGA